MRVVTLIFPGANISPWPLGRKKEQNCALPKLGKLIKTDPAGAHELKGFEGKHEFFAADKAEFSLSILSGRLY